ncbi:helix-turn-helix transcriptional regulator [Azospirillum sp.]|uniref:helix-turn-helix domain-containing protein n=1 Tax=Azospirillum sp. TaxID=34012 RepID=UPI002D3E5A23|nr:helix-turn-helix transcriptional regulator [Azospirillum sp.]HYD69267.1 helix-turn-helix transcriptional regulator [Azospirillum sp.]
MDGFGNALRQRASEIGLSDAEVARRAGLDVGRYGNYVRGSREPDLATLVRISRVLQTTPNALLGVEPMGQAEHDRVLAAYNVLDDDGRLLAVRVLNAMAEHHVARDK